ncbi:GHKL domain-containing protein [Clostridium sp. AL.422]|uniref:sensor histidine kinase n=1 Tax=Clostridium TaxID=1485 RepID=UPI00293DA6D0|nr:MULTISPECIES: GHKL domain-containing protein [unclassified Clostridium]MDV4150136.1 GHKL domain-containing protein [Clostridium sp. AL.422]
MNILICFFCIIVHIPGIVLRYLPFSNEIGKQQKMKLIKLYTVLLTINFIICLIVQLTRGIDVIFYNINILSFSILMLAVNIIVIKNKIYEHLFVFGVAETIAMILISISVYIQEIFYVQDIRIKMLISNIAIILNFLILYIPIKKIIVNIFSPFSNYDSISYWKKLWVVSISLFLAGFLLTPLNKYNISLTELIGMAFIGLAILIISKGTTQDYNKSLKMEKILQQLHWHKDYYMALSENVQDVRKARHDLKYHISTITWFVENEEFEKLRKYLEEYKKTYKIDSYLPYSGNSVIDGIINHYMGIAKEHGIRFEVKCSFNNLKVRDVDLCTLLGNILENAITASKNAEGDKFINLYSENDDFQFVLIVDNSFDGVVIRKRGRIISKKNNSESGIGIPSMESICKKYNGYCTFEAENKVFHSSFILNNGIDNQKNIL